MQSRYELKTRNQYQKQHRKHFEYRYKRDNKVEYDSWYICSDLTAAQIAALGLAIIANAKFGSQQRQSQASIRTPQRNFLSSHNSTSLFAGSNSTAPRARQGFNSYSLSPSIEASPFPSTTQNNHHKKSKAKKNTCPAEKKFSEKDNTVSFIPLTNNPHGIKLTMTPELETKIRNNPELLKLFLAQKKYINTVIEEIKSSKTSIDKTIFNQLLTKGLCINFMDPDELSAKNAPARTSGFMNSSNNLTINFVLKQNDLEKSNLEGIRYVIHNEIHHAMVGIANTDCADKESEENAWICKIPLLNEKNTLSFNDFPLLENSLSAIDRRVDLLYKFYRQEKVANLFNAFSADEKNILYKLIKSAKKVSYSEEAQALLSVREKEILSNILKNKSSELNALFNYEKLIYKFLNEENAEIKDANIKKAYALIQQQYKPLTRSINTINLEAFSRAVSAYEQRTGKKLNLNRASRENPIQVPRELIVELMNKSSIQRKKDAIVSDMPYYITGMQIKDSKLSLEIDYGNGVEGFLGEFFLRRDQYLPGGVYYKYFEARFPALVASGNEQAKTMIFKMNEMSERSSDVQSFFYDPELMKLVAPEWDSYFKKYFKTHAEKFTRATPSEFPKSKQSTNSYVFSFFPSAEKKVSSTEEKLGPSNSFSP